MAKLEVSSDLLINSLFNGAADGLRINGAVFDIQRGILILDVGGPKIPECEHVCAEISVERYHVNFKELNRFIKR